MAAPAPAFAMPWSLSAEPTAGAASAAVLLRGRLLPLSLPGAGAAPTLSAAALARTAQPPCTGRGHRAAVVAAPAAMAAAALAGTAAVPRRRGRPGSRLHLAQAWHPRPAPTRAATVADVEVVDADVVGGEVSATASTALATKEDAPDSQWIEGLGLVPPADCRNRFAHSRGKLGKSNLAYIGDTVWEYLVLRHQYLQVVRSPSTESQTVRTMKQAKASVMLYGARNVLTEHEKKVLSWATSTVWRKKLKSNQHAVEQVGYLQYSAAMGLRSLLGFLYLDVRSNDERLEAVARELGLLAAPGEEDQLLSAVTEGLWDPKVREPTTFFLALAPLGHVALRLYICRYFCQRPLRDDEYIYRVQLALRQEELDLAAVGFMRDDATGEELRLMKAARDQHDTYAFAFECLLGHLALNKPYRLHQIVANFGWAVPLPGT